MDSKSLLIILCLVIIFALEGIFPHFRGRSGRIMHGLPHVITALFNGLLTRLVLFGMTAAVLQWAEGNSIGIIRMAGISPFAAGLGSFILFDIYMYFWHMANHRIGFLWLFHRAHHSDTEMDTTTALRFHPGELILSALVRLPVIILIGINLPVLILYETILNISTLFHHSNIGLPEKIDRAIRAFLVTPNMHRVHHSIELSETNSNFTSVLSFWDRLYRTFRKRKDTRTITLGLPILREKKWQGLQGFLITPFVRVE